LVSMNTSEMAFGLSRAAGLGAAAGIGTVAGLGRAAGFGTPMALGFPAGGSAKLSYYIFILVRKNEP
jgi:hypothetical protein